VAAQVDHDLELDHERLEVVGAVTAEERRNGRSSQKRFFRKCLPSMYLQIYFYIITLTCRSRIYVISLSNLTYKSYMKILLINRT
jgi:hypothetical protein